MTIEEFVVAYLDELLTEPVSGDVLSPMPTTFVTVEQTGSGERDRLRSATIAVQCYAASRAAAGRLCETVIAAMQAMESQAAISSVQLDSSYNYADTARRRPRYQAVFDVVHYL